MRVLVDPMMVPFVEPALARLGYLFPKVEFVFEGSAIAIKDTFGAPPETVAREVRYALYREKIYAETLPLRRALVEAVTGK
jgi:hypothetical protein